MLPCLWDYFKFFVLIKKMRNYFFFSDAMTYSRSRSKNQTSLRFVVGGCLSPEVTAKKAVSL